MYTLLILSVMFFGSGTSQSQSAIPSFANYEQCAKERDRVSRYLSTSTSSRVAAICVRTGS